MIREQLEKHWEVIQAFKEGKTIQCKYTNGNWIDVETPAFDITTNYRIKPSPEYIPFDFSDVEKLIGRIVKGIAEYSNPNMNHLVVTCAEDYLWLGASSSGITYKEFFKTFTFLDGLPCGKLKE